MINDYRLLLRDEWKVRQSKTREEKSEARGDWDGAA
jgi:hypothetical protein